MRVDPDKPTLVIDAWHSECGACGYGRGGYTASPALEGLPILTPGSTSCPGCDVVFTHRLNVYTDREPQPIIAAAA